ncbi:MAG: hypothetical protein QW768_06465 [Thermoproteota archaeon]
MINFCIDIPICGGKLISNEYRYKKCKACKYENEEDVLQSLNA